MKPEDIKIRCSSLGLIMTDPRTKSEVLSETCKGHLTEIMVNKKYGRYSEISSRYIEKGLKVEEDSITLYSRVKKQFFKKNEERISNEFIIGTPDLYEGESIMTAKIIRDVKSSWDIFTFFKNHEGNLNKSYYWQAQGYLALTGAKDFYLAYCLVNTPETMLIEEQRRLFYRMNCATEENPDYIEACKELEKSMVYDDITLNERLIEIHIPRDEDAIDRIYERVKACRTYMATKYKSLFDSDVLIASKGDGCTIIEKG